jgi:arginyl-tRNA synthetase
VRFIPIDKSDIEATEGLETLSDADLGPFIMELLEWVKDMNWPVALPIAKRLADCGVEIVEPIKLVLRSDDSIWKYWVLSEIVINASPKVREALSEEVIELINKPSHKDKAEDVDLVARDIMVQYGHGI